VDDPAQGVAVQDPGDHHLDVTAAVVTVPYRSPSGWWRRRPSQARRARHAVGVVGLGEDDAVGVGQLARSAWIWVLLVQNSSRRQSPRVAHLPRQLARSWLHISQRRLDPLRPVSQPLAD
jgi:hypothetical protein